MRLQRHRLTLLTCPAALFPPGLGLLIACVKCSPAEYSAWRCWRRCPPRNQHPRRRPFITEPRAVAFPRPGYWSVASAPATSSVMGEHVALQNIADVQTNRKRPSKQTAAAIGHKLLEIIVYRKTCRMGDKLSVFDL